MSRTVLDLFSGLGGFSAAFEDSPDWEVVTVDIEDRFDPDIRADILNLRPSDLPDADVVLASPPCPAFSPGGGNTDVDKHRLSKTQYYADNLLMPSSETGIESILLANWARALAESLARPWYVIENPKGGLRNFWGRPDYHVWYCQYNGEEQAKPTDLWGRLPETFTPLSCTRENPYCDHTPASRGSDAGTQSSDLSPAERAKVPYNLSEAIRDAVDEATPPEEPPHQQGTIA